MFNKRTRRSVQKRKFLVTTCEVGANQDYVRFEYIFHNLQSFAPDYKLKICKEGRADVRIRPLLVQYLQTKINFSEVAE